MMTKSCQVLAILCLAFALPLRAFDWETATSQGREYVTLHSFCLFYGFGYAAPSGNDRFVGRNSAHAVSLKVGTSDAYIDGVHYVLSFPVEGGDHDWLVSRMDVIKLFEPILRPSEISGRHTIRGVVIDAGHGGSDNGAGSRLGNEKTYTLDTARRLESILRSAGLKTVLTRNSDVFVDLYERAHIASLYPDYCFVSIHYNSASEEARGLETYCLSPRGAASTSSRYLTRGDIQKLPGNDYDTQNVLLASMVHSEIVRLNPGDATADRGVKRARFVVIKANVLPAILVEGGFVSNHMEASRVNRADYRQNLAEAIARGVIRFSNTMGDRHMTMPSFFSNLLGSEPAPKEIPIAPPAPSGLVHETANEGENPDAGSAEETTLHRKPTDTSLTATTETTTPATTPSGTHKSKHGKNKKTVGSSQLSKASPAASATTPAATADSGNATTSTTARGEGASSKSPSGATALNLADPAPPPPSAATDKAPAEPDEPPTVNIYATGANEKPPATTNSDSSPATPAPHAP